jgi:hypothetical protein
MTLVIVRIPWTPQCLGVLKQPSTADNGATVMTLNDLLTAEGIDSQRVLVMRHRPWERGLNKVLPWLAAEKPDLFNAVPGALLSRRLVTQRPTHRHHARSARGHATRTVARRCAETRRARKPGTTQRYIEPNGERHRLLLERLTVRPTMVKVVRVQETRQRPTSIFPQTSRCPRLREGASWVCLNWSSRARRRRCE